MPIKRISDPEECRSPLVYHPDSPFKRTLSELQHLAQLTESVLLYGETGTGKEEVARRIHAAGNRNRHSMIAVNCANLTGDLVASELFGHEGGAYTGSTRKGRIGAIEAANQGTLFLDEIADLPINVQARLLRVLDGYAFTRVGGVDEITSDVRVISASNQDLRERVAQGLFRRDLFFRLSTLPLRISPLRERNMDVLPLLEHFMASAEHGEELFNSLDDSARQDLVLYSWPGNVRQVKQVASRLVLHGPGSRLTPETVSRCLGYYSFERQPDCHVGKLRHALSGLLNQVNGNQSAAARHIGISRRTFRTLIDALGVPPWG